MPDVTLDREPTQTTTHRGGRVGGSWTNLLVLAVVTALVVGAVWWFQGGDDGDFSEVAVESAVGPAPQVGEPAPGFSGLLTTDETLDLESLRGEPVWLVFNATWCANCRSEAPEVQALHDQGDVQVVSVWLRESRSQVVPYMERTNMSFTSIPDPTGQISSRYQVRGVPSHYLIDADGTLQSVHVGALSHDQFAGYSQELMGAVPR